MIDHHPTPLSPFAPSSPSSPAYLAIDMGAESGRGVLGRFDGERVALEEVHRFPNVPVRLPSGLHWDALRLFAETTTALAKAKGSAGAALESVGVDAWGVDFGLLDRDGVLLGNPYHYRDRRTEGMRERATERVSAEEIYRTTGIQEMPINTLYQLLAMEGSPQLAVAEKVLTIPDLLGCWLSGEAAGEATIASTTQLYDPSGGDWARGLIANLGLPGHIFPHLIAPGTLLGHLLAHAAEEAGVKRLPVIAVASHDTASAVAAVPAEGDRFAYISSGTWSLVGMELPHPVLTTEAMAANFTNETGLGGTTRLLKNVMGLWLLQECRRTWAREGWDLSYEELAGLAAAAPPFGPLIDPDHSSLLPHGDMPARIRVLCRANGQQEPVEPGAVVRCALESLALKYRWVLETLEAVTGRPVEVVHVVGGGSRNDLLCRLTAAATGRPVLAGPVEATALGNVLVQALARGQVRSSAEIRAVVRRSVEVVRYDPPADRAAWDEAFARMKDLVEATSEGLTPP